MKEYKKDENEAKNASTGSYSTDSQKHFQFGQTAIIIIEVKEEGRAPELKYVTIGVLGSHLSEDELADNALNYVQTVGKKTVKKIIKADSDKYQEFIESSIKAGLESI